MKHFILFVTMLVSISIADTVEIKAGESISKAIVSARSGDTILIHPGVYKESIATKSGITLKGTDAATTIIKGNGRKTTIKLSGSAVVENLTITNGQNGISCQSGNARISNCIVTANRGSGILVVKALPTIENTIISHNGGNGIKATTIGGGSLILENLTIAQNNGYGLDIESTEPLSLSNSVLYKNNLKAINDKQGKIIASNNVIYPEQKEFIANNRTAKPFFNTDKKKQKLFIQTENSPGKGAGATLQ